MSKTVFILGAGASRQGGAPLMHDFLDVARDLVAVGKTGPARTDFERVFSAISALKVVHSNSRLNIENIETLFAACEMGKTLRRFPGLTNEEQIDQVLSSLRRLIVRTLELKLQFQLTKDGGHARIRPPEPYGDFAELLHKLQFKCKPPHRVAVITFNYDIGADFALILGASGIRYGFDGEDAQDGSIPLLKLHGSISWGQEAEDPHKIVPLDIGEIYQAASLFMFEAGPFYWTISKSLEKNPKLTGEPVLVPPTWNKSDSHRQLEGVWSSAASELSDAENIFVIGYSMPETDAFFRHLYALGTVGQSMIRRFWVFNPDKTLEPRFRQLLGPAAEDRFEFNPQGVSDFQGAIEFLRRTFAAG